MQSLGTGMLSSWGKAPEGLRWEFGWIFCIEVEKDYKKMQYVPECRKEIYAFFFFPWLRVVDVLHSIVNHHCLPSQSYTCKGIVAMTLSYLSSTHQACQQPEIHNFWTVIMFSSEHIDMTVSFFCLNWSKFFF